jgi:heptosyltransferase-2
MLKYDCKFFTGMKPCKYHKDTGIKCDTCSYFEAIEFKILIIKLDAIGDVLRTTSILPALKKKYPKPQVTWCTRKNSAGIFVNNPFVDELIFVEEDAYFRITSEKYDLIINLDTSKLSSAIATSASGVVKQGFTLSHKGFVEPTSSAANAWLLMSAFDDEKKKNTKTHQQIMYNILELEEKICRPVLNVTEEAQFKIASGLKDWNYKRNLVTIGLNIGVGTKWPSKAWPVQNWESLINYLQRDEFNLLLLGGPEEEKQLVELKNKYPFLLNTGSNNSLMEFAAIVDLCDVIVTADTLALHIATALGKKIIALFGPTSSNEIELYEKGVKMIAGEECKCYYNKFCSEEVSCMKRITGEEVYESLKFLTGGIIL